MDDPFTISWRATINGVVVGVLWGAVEGGLDETLAYQVMLGQRRVRGHLLPQSLATHSGFEVAARQRFLRVVRVAVNAESRQQGVGSALVRVARDHAIIAGLDALGTSFGGNPELMGFWQRNRLMPVRLGLTRESSSGELPLQMLCGTSDAGRRLTNDLRKRLASHWLTLLPVVWPDLNPDLLWQVMASLPAGEQLDEDDHRDLNSFAFGHRGFELTLPVLRSLSLQEGVARSIPGSTDHLAHLWARVVLQGWDWTRSRRSELCRGREEGEARLRLAVQQLLQNRSGL
jgi:tRNA(Met) cytidine acetyltransferase